ncbi:MAG: hypothetical protein GY742_01650 [Hyphomicrobiales bacterium]|nr:hypothetical protein [Hyphomicrobiales bacterium]
MKRPGILNERHAALFLFAIMVLSPPFLFIFDKSVQFAGIPVLYLYLFVVWALLIALLAFASELSRPERDREE